MLLDRISIELVLKENFWDIQVCVLWRSSRGRPVNVLGTSRINLPGVSLEHQIRTSRGRHIGTWPQLQIGTSLGRWNRIFRRRPKDVGGGSPRNVEDTNIFRLGKQNRQIKTNWGYISKIYVKYFITDKLKEIINCKIILKQLSCIINRDKERFVILIDVL